MDLTGAPRCSDHLSPAFRDNGARVMGSTRTSSTQPISLEESTTVKNAYSNPWESEVTLCAKYHTRMGPRAARELAAREASVAAQRAEEERERLARESITTYDTVTREAFRVRQVNSHGDFSASEKQPAVSVDEQVNTSSPKLDYRSEKAISLWESSAKPKGPEPRDASTLSSADKLFVRDLPPHVTKHLHSSQIKILRRIRDRIIEVTGPGGIKGQSIPSVRSLCLAFKKLDYNGNKKLDPIEFWEGMAAYGVPLTEADVATVMVALDVDGDRSISFDEFLRFIRGSLSPERMQVIERAFAKLDRAGSGYVTLKDISEIYDFSSHHDVVHGFQTEENVAREFMSHFDIDNRNDDRLTLSDFVESCRDISASCDQDEEFENIMVQAWKL
jgi:Ca2+-binding EF-hand superfamily protein